MAHTPSLKPRALSPSPLPHLHSHQYAVPGLWEARREAELAVCRQLRPLMWLPVRKERCQRAGGTAKKLKLHLGLLTGVLSSGWAACSPFILHRAGVLHRAPFLCNSDVFAISLATAGPHLPCQAGQGCAGGTGPARGESSGWWRHRSNHLVNASKPGHRNPFAFPGSDNYMQLMRNKKGRPKASLASKPNGKKKTTQTNKLLQQQQGLVPQWSGGSCEDCKEAPLPVHAKWTNWPPGSSGKKFAWGTRRPAFPVTFLTSCSQIYLFTGMQASLHWLRCPTASNSVRLSVWRNSIQIAALNEPIG